VARVISIDLGSHAVKIATWKVGARNAIEPDKRFSQPVPQDGAPATLEQRLAALDALLDDQPKLKPSSSDVVVMAWPSSEAAFHRLSMPFTDRAQIERTLPFAVENEVPFELDDMVLSWRMAESNEQTQVIAVLARRERVREWLDALVERGIDPAAVHVDADLFGPWAFDPPAVVQLDDALDRPPAPLVAILDLGHAHTAVSVVRNGVVQFARSVNVGGHAFTKAIQEALGCSWEEAERFKHGDLVANVEDAVTDLGTGQHSGYATLPPEARAKVDQAIGLLLAEVRSTLIKAEDVLQGEIAELRLSGGSSRMPELHEYLAADLGVPVHAAVTPKSDRIPPEFAVAYALAMTTSATQGLPADLRIGALAYKGKADILKSMLGYGFAGAMMVAFAVTVVTAVQYRSLVVEQREAEAQVREIVLQAFPDTPPSLVTTMDQARAVMSGNTEDAVQRAEVLGQGDAAPPTIGALYALTTSFPPHPDVVVELSELSITPNAITFTAEAPGGFAASSQVEAKLRENPRYKGMQKGQEQKLASGAVRFPITIPLDADAVEPVPGEEG
jgi:Tfp pilus assembly PilM family ATPase